MALFMSLFVHNGAYGLPFFLTLVPEFCVHVHIWLQPLLHIEHNITVHVGHLYALLQIEIHHLTIHKVVVLVPHGLDEVLLV